MAIQSNSNEIQYITFLFKITCILKNKLHSSTLAFFKCKVHIHNLIELHYKIQDYRPLVVFTPRGKDINEGVEQPHAQ